MSNLEIARRIANLLEARDLAGFQAMLSDDFKAKGGARELNKQLSLAFLQTLFTAFPDHRFGFTNFVEDGDQVHCTGEETGTHLDTLDLHPFGMPLSLPPTGKAFRLPKSRFTFRVAGDQVTYFLEEAEKGGGLAGILEQLGVKLP